MYITLKIKTFMKFTAQIFLLLLLAFFTLIGTALLIGTAHAGERDNQSTSYYLMVREEGFKQYTWENKGMFNSKRGCENAAVLYLRISVELYRCVPIL